ncbi:MAG: hypothetical protein ACT4OM_03930 [Actinomycetota bacterium]
MAAALACVSLIFSACAGGAATRSTGGAPSNPPEAVDVAGKDGSQGQTETDGTEPAPQSPAQPAPAATIKEPAAATRPASDLPDLVVSEVLSGQSVNLNSLVPSSTPTLVWFYAPH